MWNLGALTHQLGDAFEKVRKEYETFGVAAEQHTVEVPPEEKARVDVTPHPHYTQSIATSARPALLVSLQLYVDEEQRCCLVNLEVIHEESNPETTNLLVIREKQLQEQSQKLLQLQERNEVLERTTLSISKEDYTARCQQYEERLKAAENQIYTLTRERDGLLQRSTNHGDKDQIIREKDEMIEEIMAEGQRLSKKQLDLENAIRKKGARVKEVEGENEGLKANLGAELSKCEQLSVEKIQLNQSLQQMEEQFKKQIETQRSEFENRLRESSDAKTQAENEAQLVAREGLLTRATEAEEKCASLTTYSEQLEAELQTQNQKFEEMELKCNREVALLEEKCHEAEIRHEELLSKFPEATQPLLQQLETLQADLDSRTEDWSLVERSLLDQLDGVNRELLSAEQREQTVIKKLETSIEKYRSLSEVHEISKNELRKATDESEGLKSELEETRKENEAVKVEYKSFRNETEGWKSEHEQLEERLQTEISTERMGKLSLEMQIKQLKIEHQKQLNDLEDQLKQHTDAHLPVQAPRDEISVESETTDGVELVSSKSFQIAKDHQVERLSKQLKSLESTRDHLSAELVSVSQRAMKAESNLQDFEKMKKEFKDLEGRYASAIELLGEREEQMEEVKADLEDFKQMYREQITYVAEQLSSKMV